MYLHFTPKLEHVGPVAVGLQPVNSNWQACIGTLTCTLQARTFTALAGCPDILQHHA